MPPKSTEAELRRALNAARQKAIYWERTAKRVCVQCGSLLSIHSWSKLCTRCRDASSESKQRNRAKRIRNQRKRT